MSQAATRAHKATSQPPDFETSAHEAQAVCLVDLLNKRQPGFALKPEDKKRVSALLQAYKNGQKLRVLELSAEFYEPLLDAESVQAAYFVVEDLKLSANSDFQIVMDSLRDAWGRVRPAQLKAMELDEAIVLLLLAVTRTDKNSISYGRVDALTGRLRPTTFPMTERLLRNFLAPFGDKEKLFERVLVLGKGTVMGNPAGQLAWLYKRRKAAWEKARADYEDKLQAARREALEKLKNPPPDATQEVYALTADFEAIITGCADPDERAALLYSLSGEAFSRLLEVSDQAPDLFKRRLNQLYDEKLSPVKAAQLSAKLAVRIKRGLGQTNQWQENYWREFQHLMQKLGHWDGQEWLDKWRSGKQGKIELEKPRPPVVDKAPEPKSTSVDDLLDQQQKMLDKMRGRNMLEPHELPEGMFKSRYDEVTREQRKVLELLSRPDRLEELFELVSSQAAWKDPPEALRMLAMQTFARYCLTDMDTIKQVYLFMAGETLFDVAKDLIAIVELSYHQIVNLFKKDPKMTFARALDILDELQAEEDERARLNSREYRQSAAAQYARFNQPG